jgi:ubiquinone/menaquinone biosynthesis C-methylase UbiE
MSHVKHIEHCYNETASVYSQKFSGELDHKPFDRMILSSFAAENKDRRILDLGCGPGQTTKFIFEEGAKNILGTDLSPKMIESAKQLNPAISFETANMLKLQYATDSFGAALAFYAIVHFTNEELLSAFKEIHRVLNPGSPFLFSFHIGNELKEVENFLEKKVNLSFRFFEITDVIALLNSAGFNEETVVERHPYRDVEYPSQRAYVLCHK